MNNLLTFSYTIQSVRIQIDDQGNPWFCLKDVCDSLNLTSPSKVLLRLNRKGVNSIQVTPINSEVKQAHTFINEPNLYRVIFRSDKPEAVKFQDWVFEQVLPTLRKTGRYQIPQTRIANIGENRQQILQAIQDGINNLKELAILLDKPWNNVQRTVNHMVHKGQLIRTRYGRIVIFSLPKTKRLN